MYWCLYSWVVWQHGRTTDGPRTDGLLLLLLLRAHINQSHYHQVRVGRIKNGTERNERLVECWFNSGRYCCCPSCCCRCYCGNAVGSGTNRSFRPCSESPRPWALWRESRERDRETRACKSSCAFRQREKLLKVIDPWNVEEEMIKTRTSDGSNRVRCWVAEERQANLRGTSKRRIWGRWWDSRSRIRA